MLRTTTWGEGEGRPIVVLVHGITANAGSWWDLGPRIAAAGATAIAVELPGHGATPTSSSPLDADGVLRSLVATVGATPDLLIGHSYGGYLAQRAVLEDVMAPAALILEDPVSHQPSEQDAAAMLQWDREHLPRDVDGLLTLNPRWSRLDAAWKIVSLEQVDWEAARTLFARDSPWDLRGRASEVAARQPTWWVQPGVSRFVPPADLAALRETVGDERVVIVPEAGHSIHRDATTTFMEVVETALASAATAGSR